MAIFIKNRTIRPKTRNKDSTYRIKVENAHPEDVIIIFIDHESKDYRSIYKCNGDLFQNTDSIYFKVEDDKGNLQIKWLNNSAPKQVR